MSLAAGELAPNVTAPASRLDLTAVIEAGLSVAGADETAAPFLPALTEPKRGVRAVVLYGSALWDALRGISSQPDLFVVVDNLRHFHRRVIDRVLGSVLPPTVYNVCSAGAYAGSAYAKSCAEVMKSAPGTA